jgi:MoaA/NifB/PqqE/SkfB family radical SAM enzyme
MLKNEISPNCTERGIAVSWAERQCTPAQAAVNDVAYIDTNDVCNLRCPTCIRGLRGMTNSGRQMPLDKFGKIVEKLFREGHRQIGLFNWTEPFLNPNLDKYIKIVKSFNLSCLLSSNFSLRRIPGLEGALRSGLDYLAVSVSGFDQEIYEINHVDGNVAYVKENLRIAAALKASGATKTHIAIRLLKFPYNHAQEAKLADFARELGVEFEVAEGRGDPLGQHTILTNERAEELLRSYRSERPYEEAGKVCPLIFGAGTAINSSGTAHLCCAYPDHPALAIGSYLDLPQEEILLRRYNHPVCSACTMPRRDATPADRQALVEALQYRLR